MELVVNDVTEILTVSEVKDYLKLNPDNDEDDFLSSLITASREYCEARTGRSIPITEYTLTVYDPPRILKLPKPDIISIESVLLDGEPVNYSVDSMKRTLTFDSELTGTLTVNYRAGYETCPESIKTAMRMLVAHWYVHREAVNIGSGAVSANTAPMEMAVNAILNQYKVWWF